MFHQFDVEAILQVPLSRQVVQDVLVWSFSKKGRYTVRFGYFVAKQLRKEEINAGESSEQRAYGSLWSRLWKADASNKIKIFPGELVLIFCPHRTISFEEEWWRLRDVVYVRKRPNRFCMCFGVVGRHRMFGLGV